MIGDQKKNFMKQCITDAALVVFEESGYTKATVNDITKKAEVGYGTFYSYFKNKQELLLYLADEMGQHVGDYISLRSRKHLSLWDRMYYGVRDILEFYIKNRIVMITLTDSRGNFKEFAEREEEIKKSLFVRISHDIRYFIDKGYCREDVDDSTIIAMWCMIKEYAYWMIKQPEDPNTRADKIAQTLTAVSYYTLFNEETREKDESEFGKEH